MPYLFPFCAALISLIIGILKWRSLGKGLRLLTIHIFIVCLVELIAYLSFKQGVNNLWMLHFFTVEEFIMLSFAYFNFFGGRQSNAWILALMSLFVIGSILNSAYLQPLTTFNNNARGVGALLIILIAIVYLVFRLKDDSDYVKENSSELWLTGSILIYFSSILLTVFAINFLYDYYGRELTVMIWDVHLVVCSLYHLTYGLAFWKTKKILTF